MDTKTLGFFNRSHLLILILFLPRCMCQMLGYLKKTLSAFVLVLLLLFEVTPPFHYDCAIFQLCLKVAST